MKRVFTIAPVLLILFGCTPSPKSLVESHLQLIKDGKQAEANKQYCIPTETLKLHTVTSFKVPELEDSKFAGVPIQTCAPQIETTQFRMKLNPDGTKTAEKEPLTTVKIEVWKSDDFYQYWVKNTAEINNLERTTAEIVGRKPVYLPQRQRSEVNSAPKCLVVEAEGVVN